jgi:hypothetical protein
MQPLRSIVIESSLLAGCSSPTKASECNSGLRWHVIGDLCAVHVRRSLVTMMMNVISCGFCTIFASCCQIYGQYLKNFILFWIVFRCDRFSLDGWATSLLRIMLQGVICVRCTYTRFCLQGSKSTLAQILEQCLFFQTRYIYGMLLGIWNIVMKNLITFVRNQARNLVHVSNICTPSQSVVYFVFLFIFLITISGPSWRFWDGTAGIITYTRC